MAFFDTSSEALIASALAEGRVVFLVGPRRSGLTPWVRRAFARRLPESDPGLAIDLAEHSTVNALRAELTSRFRLAEQPQHPRDLQVLLGATGEHLVCLFLNAHRAAPDALDWLVSALLDSMAGGTGRERSFVVEGAVDVDTVLDRAFGAGWPSVPPLVEYTAPRTPWRSLVEIESLCDSRAKRHHPALAPWVADRSGGDLGLVVELLTGIPDTEILEDAYLEATCERVVRSSGCSREISAAAMSEGEPGLAKRVIGGLPIPAVPPPVLRSGPLKDLYLAGIAEYDSILGGYRSRSPLVAQIVARALGFSHQELHLEGAEIHARNSYLLWQIAHIELSLRSRVAGLDCSRLAADARTPTQWFGLGKKIKSEAARRNPAIHDVMGTLAEVLREILPDRETILKVVERRLGIDASAMTYEDILSGLTFHELLEVANVGKVVGAADRAAIESIVAIRNDVAHFRPTSYDRMHRAVQNVRVVLRSVQGED